MGLVPKYTHANMHAFMHFCAVIAEMLFMLDFNLKHILSDSHAHSENTLSSVHETRAFPPMAK